LNLIDDTVSLSFSPLFLELLAKRGFQDPHEIDRFIHVELKNLEDPLRMKGMDLALKRIRQAVARKEKILIHGDYDVDGVTATAILARTLDTLGALVQTFLPERMKDGYGVSVEAILRGHEQGVSLLITADCGITAHRQIQTARTSGMDVIVIDHHRIPKEGLPPATVILNPQQEDCPYPFKDLSAAGLAFKLSQALLGERAFAWMDLAALSTVCDIAPLKEENRILVKHGMRLLATKPNIGLKALAAAAGVKAHAFNVSHLGFVLGPRINAAGRMSTPDIALQLLMTENAKEAESLAQVLNEENKLRQKEERETVRQAMLEVEKSVNFNRDRVIVVWRRGWHAGVIGIVASRIVDRFHRPALVIAVNDGIGKGSGRSIKQFHLFNALESCKDLFEEFGGHEQAVGLSIREENLAVFRQRVNQYAAETYSPETFIRKVPVDLEIELDDLGPRLIRELKMLEPHGAGNPRPVFQTKNLQIKNKPVSQNSRTLQFWVTDGSVTYEALWSAKTPGTDRSFIEKDAKVDLVYSVKTRIWDGMESLILEVKGITPLEVSG